MKFMTISTHRSGSSFLHRMLDNIPKVRARQEDLRTEEARKNVENVLDGIYSSLYKYDAVGTKVQYTHINNRLIRYIIQKDIKIIQLIRRNLLDVCFWYPECFKAKLKSHGFGPPLIVDEEVPVIGYPKKIHKAILEVRKGIEKYSRYAHFTLSYNDICNGKNVNVFYDKEVKRKLLELLGKSDYEKSLAADYSKAKRKPLKDLVQNYDDVFEYVKDIYYYEK